MNAATATATTSASLTCWIMECCAVARPETISATRLTAEYKAPPTAKQPQSLADVKVSGQWWSLTRTRAGTGGVVWLARPIAG